jgi:MFS family permease
MNLPLGFIALAGVWIFFKETPREEKRKVDGMASLWLVLSISSMMYILVEGGVGIPWFSWTMGALVSVVILSIFLFIRNERKSSDPMVPLHLWSIRSIRYANLTSFTTGMILIGVSSYLPAFVQGVMGQSPTIAGFTLTTLSIGWPIASTFAGRLFLTIGFRATSILGGVSLLIGGMLFTLLSPEHGPWFAATASFFIGIGMGLASTSFIVSIQNTVKWESRGIATAANMFMRTIGSALVAALLGGLLNGQIQKVIQSSGMSQELSVNDANLLLQEAGKEQLGTEAITVLQEGLTSGLNLVYTGLFIVAVVSFLLILRLPKNED